MCLSYQLLIRKWSSHYALLSAMFNSSPGLSVSTLVMQAHKSGTWSVEHLVALTLLILDG